MYGDNHDGLGKGDDNHDGLGRARDGSGGDLPTYLSIGSSYIPDDALLAAVDGSSCRHKPTSLSSSTPSSLSSSSTSSSSTPSSLSTPSSSSSSSSRLQYAPTYLR